MSNFEFNEGRFKEGTYYVPGSGGGGRTFIPETNVRDGGFSIPGHATAGADDVESGWVRGGGTFNTFCASAKLFPPSTASVDFAENKILRICV